MGTNAAAVEKTEDDLRKEIDELQRQQREITERLRDPRGLRRGGFSGPGPRNFAANGPRRGFVRPGERNDAEDQPPAKRRLSSAVVKMEEDGEINEEAEGKDAMKDTSREETSGSDTAFQNDVKQNHLRQSGSFRLDGNKKASRMDFEVPAAENVPRILPKNEDPSLVSRNKRMLGQLLGTLEKFRKEDKQLSGTEAFMRRSDSLQRAEQRAREESERLRQQEREQIAEKRKRDLMLRARVAAKAEEKKLELLFLRWSEHHKKLCNFIRTKTEPSIYYLPNKPLDEDATFPEQRRDEAFMEWKASRREELSEYQKQIGEQYIANVEKDLERWQNARRARKGNNDVLNLQETMDKELDTHRLEHGPKKRNIPGGSNNEDEDDVEDINVGEDDMIDDVLGVEDNGRRGEETVQTTKMALNPQYADIGNGFVQQYYAIFDDPAQRANVVNFYSATESFMTFEGQQLQGSAKIMEKFNSLSFQKISRVLTAIDSQPMFDGGVLINVLGRLQCDEDPPHAFSQVFVLKPLGGTFFCAHDIFRLNIHDTA